MDPHILSWEEVDLSSFTKPELEIISVLKRVPLEDVLRKSAYIVAKDVSKIYKAKVLSQEKIRRIKKKLCSLLPSQKAHLTCNENIELEHAGNIPIEELNRKELGSVIVDKSKGEHEQGISMYTEGLCIPPSVSSVDQELVIADPEIEKNIFSEEQGTPNTPEEQSTPNTPARDTEESIFHPDSPVRFSTLNQENFSTPIKPPITSAINPEHRSPALKDRSLTNSQVNIWSVEDSIDFISFKQTETSEQADKQSPTSPLFDLEKNIDFTPSKPTETSENADDQSPTSPLFCLERNRSFSLHHTPEPKRISSPVQEKNLSPLATSNLNNTALYQTPSYYAKEKRLDDSLRKVISDLYFARTPLKNPDALLPMGTLNIALDDISEPISLVGPGKKRQLSWKRLDYVEGVTVIPSNHWRTIIDSEGEIEDRVYVSLLEQHFRFINSTCVIQFHKKGKRKKEGDYDILAYCSFYGCKFFKITCTPNAEKNIEMKVRSNCLNHYHKPDKKLTRYARSVERKLYAEKLKHQTSDNLRRELILNARSSKFVAGNLGPVKSTTTFRKIISNDKLSKDHDRDDYIDIVEMKKKMQKVKQKDGSAKEMPVFDFIQYVHDDPFTVRLYSSSQAEVLKILNRDKNSEVTMHIDATGRVVRKPDVDSKRVLYYAIVVSIPDYIKEPHAHPSGSNQRGTTFAISEMITADHSTHNMYIWLCDYRFFLLKYMKWPPCINIVSDMAYPFMNAVAMAWNNHDSIFAYLNTCYEIMKGEKELDNNYVIINLCCAHYSKIIEKHVKKFFDEKKYGLEKVEHIIKVIAILFNCTTYDEIKTWFKHFVYLISSKTHNELFMEAQKSFDNIIQKEVEQSYESFTENDSEKLRDELYKESGKSVLFAEFKEMASQLLLTLCDDDSASYENPLYHPSYLDEFIDKHVPYLPLFTPVILSKRGLVKRQSNATVEGYFNKVKKQCESIPDKCSRFFLKTREEIDSEVKAVFLKIPSRGNARMSTPKRKQNLSKTETWNKKSKNTNTNTHKYVRCLNFRPYAYNVKDKTILAESEDFSIIPSPHQSAIEPFPANDSMSYECHQEILDPFLPQLESENLKTPLVTVVDRSAEESPQENPPVSDYKYSGTRKKPKYSPLVFASNQCVSDIDYYIQLPDLDKTNLYAVAKHERTFCTLRDFCSVQQKSGWLTDNAIDYVLNLWCGKLANVKVLPVTQGTHQFLKSYIKKVSKTEVKTCYELPDKGIENFINERKDMIVHRNKCIWREESTYQCKVFVPLIVHGDHFTLIYVDFERREFSYFDPLDLKNKSSSEKYKPYLLAFLEFLIKHFNISTYELKCSEWKILTDYDTVLRPQVDYWSCGVMVTYYVRLLLEKMKIIEVEFYPETEQRIKKNIAIPLRRKLCTEILKTSENIKDLCAVCHVVCASESVDFIMCDCCCQWFHLTCAPNEVPEDPEEDLPWYCFLCQNYNKNKEKEANETKKKKTVKSRRVHEANETKKKKTVKSRRLREANETKKKKTVKSRGVRATRGAPCS